MGFWGISGLVNHTHTEPSQSVPPPTALEKRSASNTCFTDPNAFYIHTGHNSKSPALQTCLLIPDLCKRCKRCVHVCFYTPELFLLNSAALLLMLPASSLSCPEGSEKHNEVQVNMERNKKKTPLNLAAHMDSTTQHAPGGGTTSISPLSMPRGIPVR